MKKYILRALTKFECQISRLLTSNVCAMTHFIVVSYKHSKYIYEGSKKKKHPFRLVNRLGT